MGVLSDRIKSLELVTETNDEDSGFNYGVRDAATIAAEADELMISMGNALASVEPDQLTLKQQDDFSSVIIKYNKFKERTQ